VGRDADSLPCVIVVLDDDGGGIFSYLPIAERRDVVDLERWYLLPHGLDLARAAALYGLAFTRVDQRHALAEALEQALRAGGTHVLCVPLDRDANVGHHRAIQRRVAAALADAAPVRRLEALSR
jgi:2-succinyl-5-enolpyruvyl-6-hydroxy-3-cyclohexene-1-carboxylate synthase